MARGFDLVFYFRKGGKKNFPVAKQVSLLRTVSKKMNLNLANLVCCWVIFYLFNFLAFVLTLVNSVLNK